MGHWLIDQMHRVYISFFSITGMLAAGGYPGVATNEFDQYCHSRFTIVVPKDLIDHLMPCINGLKQVQTKTFMVHLFKL